MQKLTIKQQKFADEYIIGGNATQSDLRLGTQRVQYNKQVLKTC